MIELPLWLAIAAKVLFAASVVVGATAVAEKSGPLIAGLIIAMPLSIGPTYVLLALAATPQFVAASAVGSIGANIAVALFATIYILLARRLPMPAALTLALAAWFGVSWLVQRWDPAPITTLVFSTLALVVASLLTRRAVAGRALLAGAKRWYDLPLRALFVGMFAGLLVTISHAIGPDWTGFLAGFPLVLTTTVVLMHPRVGPAATAAALAIAVQGILLYPCALFLIYLYGQTWGIWWSFLAALLVIVGWAGLVYAWRSSRGVGRA